MYAVRHQAILFIKIHERADFLFVILITVVQWLELWSYFIHFILFQ